MALTSDCKFKVLIYKFSGLTDTYTQYVYNADHAAQHSILLQYPTLHIYLTDRKTIHITVLSFVLKA